MTDAKLTALIEAHQDTLDSPIRNYIGASSIGSDCLRQIWYEFKGVKSSGVSAKVKRTWEIGRRLESMILDLLEGAGIKLLRNVHFEAPSLPLFQGNVDALWLVSDDERAIIEIKTAKDKSFILLLKDGVKKWSEKYYAQIQAYMGMSDIHEAYIIVLNKDTSELYDARIEFDYDYYLRLHDKALMISEAVVSPPRINGSPLWYMCKMCKFNKVCHSNDKNVLEESINDIECA